jgi:hypothetical protein
VACQRRNTVSIAPVVAYVVEELLGESSSGSL